MKRPAFLPDNFTLLLVATVALATLLPAQGVAARFFDDFTTFAIGLLFFLHGAKLSRDAIRAGISHWRLHLLVFACTFVLFPLLGLALKPLLQPLVTRELYVGVLFLCVLPATVQSAIAFTSIARGNIPAAVCSASASTMLGVFVTPVLVGLVVLPHSAGSTNAFDSIGHILMQLMLPFVAGHLLRPWISGWLEERKQVLGLVDRGSILLVVYTAFSAAVIEGLWKQVPLQALAGLLVVCAVILALAVGLVSEVVEEDGLEAAVEPYLDAMMTASPIGLRLSKECLNMAVDAGSIEAVIAMEDRNQVLCSRSEDFNEGIRAFLEKRKPVYIRG